MADKRHVAGYIDTRRAGHLTRSRRQDIALAGRAIVGVDVAGKDFSVGLQGLSDETNDLCGKLLRFLHDDGGHRCEQGLQVLRTSGSCGQRP